MLEFRCTDRPNKLPAVVFSDASFVADMFAALRPADPTFASTRARANVAHAFYVWARPRGVRFVTSPLALEEIYRRLLFREVDAALPGAGVKTWKELRTKDQTLFATKLSAGRKAVGRFHNAFTGMGIDLVMPGGRPTRSELVAAKHVSLYVRALLAKYEIDAMDALHISLMRYAGLEWAITADHDWWPVDTIRVILA